METKYESGIGSINWELKNKRPDPAFAMERFGQQNSKANTR